MAAKKTDSDKRVAHDIVDRSWADRRSSSPKDSKFSIRQHLCVEEFAIFSLDFSKVKTEEDIEKQLKKNAKKIAKEMEKQVSEIQADIDEIAFNKVNAEIKKEIDDFTKKLIKEKKLKLTEYSKAEKETRQFANPISNLDL